MKISLVIPAFNEERQIGACLESVLEHAQGRLSEIIVVDNASTDRTAEIARGYPKVRTVPEMRKGTGYARQRGLHEASGDLVAFIDADVRLPAGWLDIAQRAFDSRPGIVALSGPYCFDDGPRWLRRMLLAAHFVLLPLAHLFLWSMIISGNFVARKHALDAIGGFDPTISLFADDADISWRIKTQGRVLFRNGFFVYSSTRRYKAEGLLRVSAKYAVNFLWIFLFHRPFSPSRSDIGVNHQTNTM